MQTGHYIAYEITAIHIQEAKFQNRYWGVYFYAHMALQSLSSR